MYGHPTQLLVREGLKNIPSHVTTKMILEGTVVHHAQKTLETPTGKIVRALDKAKTGGWSIRAGGQDGGRGSMTHLAVLEAVDFVHTPSFRSLERVQESVTSFSFALVQEALVEEGLEKKFASEFVNSWEEAHRLQLREAERRLEMVEESYQTQEKEIKKLKRVLEQVNRHPQEMFGLIKETVKNSPFVISEKTQQILSQGISDPDDLHYVEELAGIQVG